jgi:hypothetical protein
LQTLTPAYFRASAIEQLKGKGNRTPGYVDYHKTGGIRFPDEVVFWENAFRRIDVSPEQVKDFPAFREEPEPVKLQANSGVVCTGFDLPYKPRHRSSEVVPNRRSSRRSSKRRSSKRRSSRRRSSRR